MTTAFVEEFRSNFPLFIMRDCFPTPRGSIVVVQNQSVLVATCWRRLFDLG